MKTIQVSKSGAHRSAVLIEERVICELDGSWQEAEVNGVAKMLQTDIALEMRNGKLWLRSVRVGEKA